MAQTCKQANRIIMLPLLYEMLGQRNVRFTFAVSMATHLQAGQIAPDFTGIDQDGNKVSLNDFKGQKVALYFYPEDDTPTCTIQACNLRDNYALLKQHGIKVIGVSPDNETSHQKFREKFDLPFTLIADPEHKIIDKYGVWGEKNMYGRKYMGLLRTTFAINEDGTIRKIFLKPKNKAHAEEIVKQFQDGKE